MKLFFKLVYLWAVLAILIDLMTILTPEVKQVKKQEAAMFGIMNCLVLLYMHNKAWPIEEKKQPPKV